MAGLPVEIFHRIGLGLLPPSLLVLSQCNKTLHAFLSKETYASNELWKNSRKMCDPALPSPPPGWSEYSYARFIFGSSPCEICGVETQRLPVSLSIRLKVCDKETCKSTAFRDVVGIMSRRLPESVELSMLWIEPNARFDLQLPRGYTLLSRVSAALLEFENMSTRMSDGELCDVYRKRAAQRPQLMDAAHKYIAWRDDMQKHGSRAATRTQYELKKLAARLKWKHSYLVYHPVGQAYMRISVQTGVYMVRNEWDYVESAARPGRRTETRRQAHKAHAGNSYQCRHCSSTRKFSISGIQSHIRSKHDIRRLEQSDYELAEEPSF